MQSTPDTRKEAKAAEEMSRFIGIVIAGAVFIVVLFNDPAWWGSF